MTRSDLGPRRRVSSVGAWPRQAGVLAAAATLVLGLGACSGDPAPAPVAPVVAGGVTQISDISGPKCRDVPTAGAGSAQQMVDEPVVTAARGNPLVAKLVEAVAAGGLVETLDAAPGLTVLAPGNDAFAALQQKLGDAQFAALFADMERLAKLLTYHVVDKRYDAEGLVAAGTVTSLSGGAVTVGGTVDRLTFTGGDGGTARNLCGNIPTRNATVFVIDAVLMPKAG